MHKESLDVKNCWRPHNLSFLPQECKDEKHLVREQIRRIQLHHSFSHQTGQKPEAKTKVAKLGKTKHFRMMILL